MKTMKKYETFKLVMKNGEEKYYYCKKEELLDYISVRNFRNADYIEIVNKANDNTNHKIIKLEELI